ncbi:hypothetical protein NKH77_49210 [Streptomyces sp. M19]
MFDAIVVGARCAGAPTAMLLARAGYRVLVLDRADFPPTRSPPTSSTSRASPPSPAGACSTGYVRPAARR